MSATIDEMEAINPLITSDGNTYRVSSALTALADLLAEEQAMEPDSAQAYGVSVLLATCAAALCRMGDIQQKKAQAEVTA